MGSSYLSILIPKMGEDDIETFTETPAKETSVEDLNAAEEEIKEEQDESSSEQVTLDYGTPDSIEDPACVGGNCPTGDAGDVAIIDAEVAPAGDDTPDDFSDTEGADTDISEDLQLYTTLWNQTFSDSESEMPSMESFSSILEGLIGALKTLTVKVVKYTNRIYRFSRNKISSTYLRMQTVHKLWSHKISPNLSKVDNDRLSELEIEAFPYQVWVSAAQISLAAFELVDAAERIVFEPGTEAVSNSMTRFSEKLENLGIKINIPKNRMNVDELLDTRQFESVTSLGYTKSQIGTCLRYFGDIAKRVPKGDLNSLEAVTNRVIDRITQFAGSINTAVAENRLNKNSKEYRDELDKLLNYTVRYDFVLTCMKCCYYLFDKLAMDIQHVFEKYETALTDPKYI